MFAPASAASHICWCVGIQGWRAQPAGYRNLKDASLVAKDYACPNTTLIQNEEVQPRDGWLGVRARAISNMLAQESEELETV
jgi:hypothetical protein